MSSSEGGGERSWRSVRLEVLDRDGHKCQNCEKPEDGVGGLGLHVHHIKTREAGGPDEPSNLITLCKDCHNRLHRRTEGDVRCPTALKQISLEDIPTDVEMDGDAYVYYAEE